MNVAPGLPCNSVSLSPSEQHEAVLCSVDDILTLTLHEDASELVFSDVEWPIAVSVLEQVVQLFIIDLQKRAVHSEALVRVFFTNILQTSEKLLNGSWNDTKLLLVIQERICSALLHLVALHQRRQCVLVTCIVIPVRSEHGERLT